jgi:perosamine synthetase
MQKSSLIRLIKPNLSQSDLKAVERVLESGMLVSGPVVERFESLLAGFLDVPYAVCVSSGTAALHLSLIVTDIKPGDEVIVPAFTFPATANVVEMLGAKPVFVDCAPDGVNLDPLKLKNAVTSRTRAIMPVHAFGMPANLDETNNLANQYNLIIIEDAACALGSKYNGRHCGTIGDLGVFSFHPRKLLTTGEGGAIITHDDLTADILKSLRNHGWQNGDYEHLGYNYRMTDLQASLGIGQIERYDRMIAERRELANLYWQKLKSLNWIKPLQPPVNVDWNVQTLLVKFDDTIDRNQVISYLKDHDIETTIGTYCVPLIKYYRLKYGYEKNEFPHAYNMYRQSLSLPLHYEMTEHDIDIVINALSQYESQLKTIAV